MPKFVQSKSDFMQNQTPKLITEAEFNLKVRGWTINVRGRISSNAPISAEKQWGKRTSKKLAQSVMYRLKMEFGATSRIRYEFERHGIFYHYGVGRGYIREGNAVVRTAKSVSAKNRTPNDWFDVEIRQGLNQLADITQEFYGDLAMKQVLSKIDKFLIQKT